MKFHSPTHATIDVGHAIKQFLAQIISNKNPTIIVCPVWCQPHYSFFAANTPSDTYLLTFAHQNVEFIDDHAIVIDEDKWAAKVLRYLQVTHLPTIIRFDQAKSSFTNITAEFYQNESASLARFIGSEVLIEMTSMNNKALQSFESKQACRKVALEQSECGNVAEAMSMFYRILYQDSSDAISNFNLGVLLNAVGTCRIMHYTFGNGQVCIGYPMLAVHFMLQVVRMAPEDSTAHHVLSAVLFDSERNAVLRGYELLVRENSKNYRAVHILASMLGEAKSSQPEYVSQIFDDLSANFDVKLVEHLEYKVPWLLRDLVQDFTETQEANWKALDLGCGTGLCGKAFQNLCSTMTGVDLSSGMIKEAKKIALYDELLVSDIVQVLRVCKVDSMDLILAADVWIYVGQLDEVFTLCKLALAKGGLFAFSTERIMDDSSTSSKDVYLSRSGRFKHSNEYIQNLASTAGFHVRSQKACTIRMENTEPIYGTLHLLQN